MKLLPNTDDIAYVFVFYNHQSDNLNIKPLMLFEESEGTTMIITKDQASSIGYNYKETWAKISLGLVSDLNMVGLTAIFSSALARENISCNVVAAFHHDHLFVPYDKRELAMKILEEIKL